MTSDVERAETTTAASETAAVAVDCSGMVSPANATDKKTATTKGMGNGQTLQLRYGNIGGVQYAWAQVTTSFDGDMLWLDISGDGGEPWTQCDLRKLSSTGRNYGNAKRTSPNKEVKMRAGCRPASLGISYTTPWW